MRELVAALLLALCFLLACHFYGVGVHLSVLLFVCAGPFAVLILQGAQGIVLAVERAPKLTAGCLASLVVLAVHHMVISQSADTSFAPSIILASVPVWALAMLTLSNPVRVLRLAQWIVFALACYSTFEYLTANTRAFAPLPDPNNYVTLLLMAWIPWLYRQLAEAPRAQSVALTVLVTYVFATALIATQSRFALAMLLVFIGLFGLVCWLQKLQRRQFVAAAAALLLAGVVSLVIDNSVPVVALPDAAQAVVESDRWLLLEGTWRGIKEFGHWNGFGVGGFALIYPQVRGLAEQSTLGNFTHNDYLQLAMEGGVWLTLLSLLLVIVVAVELVRRVLLQRSFNPGLGPLLAVGVALAHASVNFVIYILPLAVFVGINLGAAWGDIRPSAAVSKVSVSLRLVWIATLAGMFSVGAHLALDTFTYAVFAGQKGVPGAAAIRHNPQQMFEYAQLAQSLNPQRGVPVLAEAQLRERRLTENSPVAELFTIADTYERALVVDPWNPSAYLAYHAFLVRYDAVLHAGQAAEKLLRAALRLDPTSAPVALAAMDHYSRAGDAESSEMVGLNLLQWCEFMHRRQPGASEAMLAALDVFAQKQSSEKLRASIDQCAAEINTITRPPRTLPWALRLYVGGD